MPRDPEYLARSIAKTMEVDGVGAAQRAVAPLDAGLRIIVWRRACRLAGLWLSVHFADGVSILAGVAS